MPDLYPLTIRGPVSTTSGRQVRWARMFDYEGKLYIAESRDKGNTVTAVTAYDLPEGKPSNPSRKAQWGPWKYDSCGCTNSWRKHTRESLVARVKSD